MIASSSENESVLNAAFTTWTFLASSAFSSFTERIISNPTTVVPYSLTIISSISYWRSFRYINTVPRRSPAISIGLIIAQYCWISSLSNPRVWRFTFSFVDKTLKKRSFRSGSTWLPTLSSINSVISSTPGHKLTPRTFPFLLITRILESNVSIITLQISLNTTFVELLLCSNLLIFLVLSNNCTLIFYSFLDFLFFLYFYNIVPWYSLNNNNIFWIFQFFHLLWLFYLPNQNHEN